MHRQQGQEYLFYFMLLTGAKIFARDLRASASHLLLAAPARFRLRATRTSVYHIGDRQE